MLSCGVLCCPAVISPTHELSERSSLSAKACTLTDTSGPVLKYSDTSWYRDVLVLKCRVALSGTNHSEFGHFELDQADFVTFTLIPNK